MPITLIGLGVKEGDLTLSAERALKAADKILARTCVTESFKSLKNYAVQTLDGVFESSRNFDTLNKNLAKAVLKENRNYTVEEAELLLKKYLKGKVN